MKRYVIWFCGCVIAVCLVVWAVSAIATVWPEPDGQCLLHTPREVGNGRMYSKWHGSAYYLCYKGTCELSGRPCADWQWGPEAEYVRWLNEGSTGDQRCRW